MYSIYHFFAHLSRNKSLFLGENPLEQFPFDTELLSARSKGKFPDLVIRLNEDQAGLHSGGELIELKDSEGYAVSSFNSTIPTGVKNIQQFATPNSGIYKQMVKAGEEPKIMPLREVFYLIRGRKEPPKRDPQAQGAVKVCLVHGSFFETVKVETLIQKAFLQVFDEVIERGKIELGAETRNLLLTLFPLQESFSKVRDVENASVKLRFRIMTEAKEEGNVLNPDRYPEISDNTLNFIIPCETTEQQQDYERKMQGALAQSEYEKFRVFRIKHLLNGPFLVFQTDLHQ